MKENTENTYLPVCCTVHTQSFQFHSIDRTHTHTSKWYSKNEEIIDIVRLNQCIDYNNNINSERINQCKRLRKCFKAKNYTIYYYSLTGNWMLQTIWLSDHKLCQMLIYIYNKMADTHTHIHLLFLQYNVCGHVNRVTLCASPFIWLCYGFFFSYVCA